MSVTILFKKREGGKKTNYLCFLGWHFIILAEYLESDHKYLVNNFRLSDFIILASLNNRCKECIFQGHHYSF